MSKKDLEKEFMDHIIRNEAMIHKVCNIYSSSHVDRQDLRQEIIYQLWRSFPSFQGRSKFQTWLYRVALNTAIYYNRKKQPYAVGLSNIEIQDEEGWKELEEKLRRIYMAIRALNQIDRAIIFLYLERHSYEQIAEISGLSQKNVSVRIVRIKEKLRQTIKKTE